MDLKTYQEKAIRTMKYMGEHPLISDSLKFNLTINKQNAPKVACRWDHAHMIMGMCSELNELQDALQTNDLVNIEEELADIMWYTSNEGTLAGISLVAQIDLGTYHFAQLTYAISDYCDLLKKNIVYNKEISFEDRAKKLQKIINILYNFDMGGTRHGESINLSQAMERNIDKLMKRYPDRYSDELANNRDLTEERKALEGTI